MRDDSVDPEMQGILDRTAELMRDLANEYDACGQRGKVSERAKNLFHEVLVKIRSSLDFTMNRIFNSHTQFTGTKKARAERRVAERKANSTAT